MKRAIVLSGGGSRGAYQIGFWKAIRELGITYDIVTGTSIGALNGAFMVQGDYKNAFKLWYFMDYNRVLDNELKASFNTPSGRKKIIMKYAKGAMKGGLDVPALEKTITDNFNPKLFFSSPVDYGLVTAKFPSFKPAMITKDQLTSENMTDYLLASAACFPAFKMKSINDETYIDGGYYDNLPINLALKLGADEIIAVNLRALGSIKKVKNSNVKITLIAPVNNIGNFLVMEKAQARMSIRFGYNDTMKAFNALEGKKYTFKKGSLERNFNRNQERFYELFNTYLKGYSDKPKYKKFLGKNKVAEISNVLEKTAAAFGIDESVIYRTSMLNTLIKKSYKKIKNDSFKSVKHLIKSNTIRRFFVSKEMICYFYDEINKSKKPGKILNNLALLFPDSYLCALYLKTIMR